MHHIGLKSKRTFNVEATFVKEASPAIARRLGSNGKIEDFPQFKTRAILQTGCKRHHCFSCFANSHFPFCGRSRNQRESDKHAHSAASIIGLDPPPRFSVMRRSISGRKCLIRPWIGQAAASPSAQIVWPSTCLVT